MTKRQTINAIKALGLTARWSVEWQEFIVNYRIGDPRRTSDSSAHTSDASDALGTAQVMAGAFN